MDHYLKFARQFLSLILVLFFFTAPGAKNVFALNSLSDICLDCHQENFDSYTTKKYIHAPFIKQQCYKCHLNRDLPMGSATSTVNFPDQIRWLESHDQPLKKHTFMVADDQIDFTLYIEADLTRRNTYKKISAVPKISALPILENNGVAPVISDIRVEEITRGLFLSATISWNTDEPSSGQIFFGMEDTRSTSGKSSFSTHHRITISPLKSKKDYKFYVTSTDWFNNESRSDIASLSTDQPMAPEPDDSGQDSLKELQVKTNFRSLGDKYIIEITCNRPTTMTIGVNPVQSTTPPTMIPDDHPALNNREATDIEACRNCHPGSFQANSHPINLRPKRGMLIPPEYPLLPDGRMSCMSCHAQHGSDFEFRMIKSSKRDLCVGCHREFSRY